MDTIHSNAGPPCPEEEISQAVERFSNYCFARLGFGPKTVELNVGIFRRFARAVGLKPSSDEIDGYIANVRRAGRTNTYARAIAVTVERYMQMIGTPVKLGRPKKQKGPIISILSEAEIAVLIAQSKDIRERAILLILAYAGIRNDELCNLRVKDVDIQNQALHISKAKFDDSRVVCVAGACMDRLVEYLQWRKGGPDNLLFVTRRKGLMLATQDIRKIVRVAANRAGIRKRVHPHLFRHSLASNMLHRGAGLMAIKEQLGHRYLESTLLYLHANKDRLQDNYRQYCPSYV